FSIRVRGAGHPASPPAEPAREPTPGQARATDRAPPSKVDAGAPTDEARAVAREPAEPPNGARRLGGHTQAREARKARAANDAEAAKRREAVALRREIHRLLLEHLDLGTVEPSKLDDPSLRPKVLNALRRIVKTIEERIPAEINRD